MASDYDTSSSEEDDHRNSDNHNKSDKAPRVPVDKNSPGEKFLESLFIFRMMHENENQDGERLSSKQRANYVEKLKESYKTIGSLLEFKDYVIRSSRVRWTSFENDMKYWELYDKKEEYLKRISKDDKDKDARRIRRKNKARSRYRSRSRRLLSYR